MKTYTTKQIDALYKGNLKSFETGENTFYLDKLTTKEYAVNKDETNLEIFNDYITALTFYNSKIK